MFNHLSSDFVSNIITAMVCRRFGGPLIDGGTVRLPRLIGQGRAMDLMLTGRKVEADEALRIGLCEYLAPEGEARQKAEEIAQALCQFPQQWIRPGWWLRKGLLRLGGLRRVMTDSCTD